MLFSHKKSKGFSLIELMAAVAILGVVASIALPNYRTYIANVGLRAGAESILAGLQLARAEAVKRNGNITFTLNNDSSWTVNQGATTIARKTATEANHKLVLTKTGGNSTTFDALGNSSNQLNRVLVDTTAISATDSRELRIDILAGGIIRMCDPNVSLATDGRFCS